MGFSDCSMNSTLDTNSIQLIVISYKSAAYCTVLNLVVSIFYPRRLGACLVPVCDVSRSLSHGSVQLLNTLSCRSSHQLFTPVVLNLAVMAQNRAAEAHASGNRQSGRSRDESSA